MFTLTFWKDTAERVIATAAQAAGGVLIASGLAGLGTEEGLLITASAAALSLCKAIVAYYFGSDEISPASLAK